MRGGGGGGFYFKKALTDNWSQNSDYMGQKLYKLGWSTSEIYRVPNFTITLADGHMVYTYIEVIELHT